jgi:hypothetical protein
MDTKPDHAIADWMRSVGYYHQPRVAIDGLVLFSPSLGIKIESCCGDGGFDQFTDLTRWRDIATILAEEQGVAPDRLIAAIELAIKHRSDEVLVDASCGCRGPLEGAGILTFEEFIAASAAEQARRAIEGAGRRERRLRLRRQRYRERRQEATQATLAL